MRFLFYDRILEIDKGKRILGVKEVSLGDHFFIGHFEKKPIMPGVIIIPGHLGEAIPFWLWRIDNFWERGPLSENFRKTPSQYFRDNFAVSTSGMFHEPVLKYTLSVLGADNILFAIDFPMESPEEAIKFMDDSSLDPQEKEKIYHLNAERIFSL